MKKRRSSKELFNRIKLEMIMKVHRVSKKKAKEMLISAGRAAISAESRFGHDEELISADEFLGNL